MQNKQNVLLSNCFDGNNRIQKIRIILPNISLIQLNMDVLFFMCFFIVAGAVVLDLRTDKIPNWYLTIAVIISIYTKLATQNTTNWILVLIGVLIVFLLLFPLFVIGFFGAGDIKLLCTLAIVYKLQDLMIIFGFSLVCGAMIGIVKLIKYRNIGERFRFLLQFMNHLITSLRVRGAKALQESYIDGLEKEEVKKSGIHFSLPILLGMVIYVGVK